MGANLPVIMSALVVCSWGTAESNPMRAAPQSLAARMLRSKVPARGSGLPSRRTPAADDMCGLKPCSQVCKQASTERTSCLTARSDYRSVPAREQSQT